MAGLRPFESAPHAAGDAWTAEAADALTQPMMDTYEALIARHAAASGAHNDPRIPVAAALVTCSGTTYTLRSGYNIDTVMRTGVGALDVKLSVTLVADAWGAEVNIWNDLVHVGNYREPSNTSTVKVLLANLSGDAADVSFLLLVYGVTA